MIEKIKKTYEIEETTGHMLILKLKGSEKQLYLPKSEKDIYLSFGAKVNNKDDIQEIERLVDEGIIL